MTAADFSPRLQLKTPIFRHEKCGLQPAFWRCIFVEFCRYTCKFIAMKQALLFLLILPVTLNARRSDPRTLKVAPYDAVKSMKATYIFSNPKGNDTGITETFVYNENGWLTNYTYDLHMMKNPPYFISSVYQYQSEDSWTQLTYKNKKLSDSAVVKGRWANTYNFYEGKFHEMHEFRGDSAREKVVKGVDTVAYPNGLVNPNPDPFWDNSGVGKYARKSFVRSANTDTICYLDAQGECMVMIVNFYNSNIKPVKTEYYNYRKGRFDFAHLPYNERLDMNFFLNKSKKGAWSYQVLRKYDSLGNLLEEQWNPTGKKETVVIKKYEYQYYLTR
jgi:hypothetical protein